MASTDEETGLKSGEKSEDQDLDPDRDPELKKNGGRFDSKKAILQVTWRFPVDFKDPLNIIALIYGYLPFVIPLVFFIDMVVERRFIAFYGLAVSGVVTLINEVILKELLKQPRPYGSANRKFNEKTKKWEMKPGMPSGHVLNATTTMVWCLLEVSLRGPGFDDHPFMTGKLLLLILICMAPVPWARIYNQDHSLAQCTVAGVLGVFAGLMAYWVRYHYFPLQAEKEWCVSKWCLGYDDDEYEDDEDYSYYSEDDSRVMTAQRVNFPTGRFKSRFTAVFEVIENDKDEETSQHRPGTPNVVIEQKPEKKVKVVVQEEAVDTSKPTDDEKTRVFPVDFERRTFHRDKVVYTKDAWGRSVVKVMNPTQRKPDL